MSIFGEIFGNEFGNIFKQPTLDDNAAELTKRFQKTAIRIIDRFIKTPNAVWVSNANDSVADSDEDWNVEFGETAEHAVKIAILPSNYKNKQFLRNIAGTSIDTGDVQGIMYKQDFEPHIKDTLLWQGQRLNVNTIDPIQPIDLPIVYIIEFSK